MIEYALTNGLILKGDDLLKRSDSRAACEIRLIEHLDFLRAMEKEDEEAFWSALAHICLHDYWAYLRFILKYRWCDPFFHGEVVSKFIQDNQQKPICILMPRGSGKTSCITQPLPAWEIAKSPLNTVVISNARDDKVEAMAAAAAAIIATNSTYQKCFPEVRPSKKWSATGGFYTTAASLMDGSAERIDPSISCYGVGGNITGSHANALMLLDDLINRKMVSASSHVELEKAREHMVEALNCVDPGTSVVVCGTRWLYTDFYGEIESGVIEANDGKFTVLKLGVYKENGSLIWPQRTFIDLAGRSQKAGYTEQQIEAAKKRDKYFAGLYHNTPLLDQDVKFAIDKISFYKTKDELPFRYTGQIQAIGIECESQGNAFFSLFLKMMRDQKRSYKVDKLTTKRVDKIIRISAALQNPISEGRFVMREDLWLSRENLGAEMKTFTKSDDDDCLDACAHFVENVIESPENLPPKPYIAVDPAFTEGRQSDHTAIVVGVKWRDRYYVLDCRRFKTDKTDHLVNLIFRIVDEFMVDVSVSKPKTRNMVAGFQSVGYSKPTGRSLNLKEAPFIIESPYLKKE